MTIDLAVPQEVPFAADHLVSVLVFEVKCLQVLDSRYMHHGAGKFFEL